MKRFRLAAVMAVLVAPLGALIPLGAAAPAQAAGPVPFTITEQINGDVTTFTATSPLCPSGTFADDIKVFAPNPESSGIDSSGTLNLLIRTVYTCDNGSGTFNAIKHVFITFNENGFTNTGPIQLLGGTGAYTGLSGHGVDNGSRTGDTGVGNISGFVIQG